MFGYMIYRDVEINMYRYKDESDLFNSVSYLADPGHQSIMVSHCRNSAVFSKATLF